MGSSFTVLNNTETVVYVSSSIAWGFIGKMIMIAGATVAAVALTIIAYTTFGIMFLHTLLEGVVWQSAALGGLGLTAICGFTWRVGEGVNAPMTEEDFDELQAVTNDLIKDMTRLDPGQAYKFRGTLSLIRNVKVLYDNGQAVHKNCFTGSTANSNREYEILDPMFAGSTFSGCWVDASPEHVVEYKGLDGVTRKFNNRLMQTRKKDIYWKEECMDQCRGYEFYGIENTVECFCSNDMDLLKKEHMDKRLAKISECGRYEGHYGSKWRIAVHKITPSPQYNAMFHHKVQQDHLRRLQLGDEALSDAELLRTIGGNKAALDLVKDLDAYNNRMTFLTSEDLAMDPRRLPAEKQAMIFVETLEKPDHDIAARRLEGYHDHEATAARLAEWVVLAEECKFPDAMTTCNSLLERKCGPCIQCEICLEDNSLPLCRTETCMQCGHCAQYPACLAVETHCAPEAKVKHAMENCDLSLEDEMSECSELQHIMKCVSEKVF